MCKLRDDKRVDVGYNKYRKTPPIHYIYSFFVTPHKKTKYLLLKGQQRKLSFLLLFRAKQISVVSSSNACIKELLTTEIYLADMPHRENESFLDALNKSKNALNKSKNALFLRKI